MRYVGRITALAFTLIAFLILRAWAYYSYGFPVFNPPVMAIICFLVAWWLGKQYDRAKYYSERDALTGLYNRRFINNVLPILLAQIDRRKAKLSIAMLDCNNFKTINDKFGHSKGDSVLQNFTSVLTANVRKGDIVARWGGDEFLIVAPYTDKEEMRAIVSRFEKNLRELSEGLRVEVTVAVGFAVYPDDAGNLNDLITIADRRMYKRKNESEKYYTKIANTGRK